MLEPIVAHDVPRDETDPSDALMRESERDRVCFLAGYYTPVAYLPLAFGLIDRGCHRGLAHRSAAQMMDPPLAVLTNDDRDEREVSGG